MGPHEQMQETSACTAECFTEVANEANNITQLDICKCTMPGKKPRTPLLIQIAS
jgi:hypothetical protein